MPGAFEIREGTDPEVWIGAFLLPSRAEGFAFLERFLSNWRNGTNRFDREGECLLVAFLGGRPAGICGLNIDAYSVDPTVGRVRHLYVLPEFRRMGLGRALVGEILRRAGERFAQVRLRTDSEAADRFYGAMGFERIMTDHSTHLRRMR